MIAKLALLASIASAVIAAPVTSQFNINKRILDDETDDGKGILFLNTRANDYDAQLIDNDKVNLLKARQEGGDLENDLENPFKARHNDDDDSLVDLHVLKRILGSNSGKDGEGNILGVGVLKRAHDLTDSSGTIDIDLLQRRGALGIGGNGYRDSTLGLFGRIFNENPHDDDPLIGVLKRGGLLSNHADHDNTISLGISKRGGILNDGSPEFAHIGIKRRGLLSDNDDKLHVGVKRDEVDYEKESIGLRILDKRSDDEIAGLDLELRDLSDDEAVIVRRVLGLTDGGRDNGNLKIDNPVGLRRDDVADNKKDKEYDAQLATGACLLNGCDTGGGVIGV
ncbi:hypothetical protein WALSEDRAFT_31274 [Wallemia mellicola CBS 633.66]|uniref:Uncharacterized protein n=2 Tax=Wallemia mellicola TaxID=1708541 RepID=I4YIJ9_WALMC|nr:hypothetical protein WALSEDRAFT_31274 [Wallemia mellicola CBS 633.66]TIB93536.1 hypothetical protein E3Q18_04465 [Wallemia mellicola]EIM23791.1 hypothetical protein WALSEDRAFT_31274 [Wallemia mellicola CBS 633.66]TIC06623.1 hypothetical protein E3Q14_04444 [Wallemia mellicola]TIC10898.1 hypothetical protein E3Q13_04459 [Wallemia mellicola]TIC22792.1 hypothetical protein E3Q10_04426 [Wallemia mellicola]|eukprot:XP_006956454.1 hypothetical protein WALSEDRAFT_31274 [Wallemia mellicola CBS 633.66]